MSGQNGQKQECEQLSIDLQNARLQLKEELEVMVKADEQAKELRKQLDAAREKLQKEIRESGFDIGASFVPGLDGKIPIITPVLEITKNTKEIWDAYQKYLGLWNELKQAIETQKWFEKRAREKEKEITKILRMMEASGCVL